MTNSVCAFINPKAFRKSRTHMGIVEQLEQHEDKSKQRAVEALEEGFEQQVVDTNDVFSSMDRQGDETDEQYEYRVNILMEKTLKGELVDEHDRLVRKSEIDFLKKFLREKRVQVLVEREVRSRRGIVFDSTEALENEAFKIQLEEDKQKGFFHDDFSYLDIIKMKDFAPVTRIEKEQAFEEVMNEEIDIDDEVDRFLKSLSGSSSTGDKQILSKDEPDTIDMIIEDASEGETDLSNKLEHELVKTVAEKAAGMNVDIKGVDLMKQRQEKMQRAVSALNRRNMSQNSDNNREDSNLDVMKFT